MAISIFIERIDQSEHEATYRYEDDVAGSGSGFFRFDKRSGDMVVVQVVPGDLAGKLAQCAAMKVYRRWKADGGAPEKEMYAALRR